VWISFYYKTTKNKRGNPYTKGRIIQSFVKKVKYPLTRADKILSYRKQHARVRHQYYSLCEKHSSLDKYLFTFTAGGRGRGVYTKLRLINEIKSYVTYLIANSKSDIYFFSNIELAQDFKSPHLHTQIWSDDKNTVKEIYERVIEKFSLKSNRCKMSEPQQNYNFYTYVIKDYHKNLSDNDIWNLEQTKKRMRKTLGFQLRFYSRSKGKYTTKLYKMVYHSYKVLRAFADDFLDFFLDTFFVKRSDFNLILKSKRIETFFAFFNSISSFICIKNKETQQLTCLQFFLFRRLFSHCLAVKFFSFARGPPFVLCYLSVIRTFGSLFYCKGVIMFIVLLFMCFLWRSSGWVVVRARSPP